MVNYFLACRKPTNMLHRHFFSLTATMACALAHAQVNCVNCYEQNEALNTTAPNLITNGSFELTTCPPNGFESFCPASAFYTCDIQDWTASGGGTSTYAGIWTSDVTALADGQLAVYFGNNYCTACSADPEDTTCLQRDGCTISGIPDGYPVNAEFYGGDVGISLSQVVSGLQPFNTYILEFWAGGEDFGVFSRSGLFAVDVGYGDVYLRCKPTGAGLVGTRYQVIFTSNSSSHTIKFTNWGHIGAEFTELVLDDVRLTAASLNPCGSTAVPAAQEPERIRIMDEQLLVDATGLEHAQLDLMDMAGRELLYQGVNGVQLISLEQMPPGLITYRLVPENGVQFVGRLFKP